MKTKHETEFFDEKKMLAGYDLPTAVEHFLHHMDLDVTSAAAHLGVSRRTLSNWRGDNPPKNDRMIRLAMLGGFGR